MSEIEGNLRPGEYVIPAQVPRWKGEVLIPFRADRQLGEALPYAKAEPQGEWTNPETGETHVRTPQTRVTPKGVDRLIEMLTEGRTA